MKNIIHSVNGRLTSRGYIYRTVNYPTSMTEFDLWFKRPARPTFQSITAITPTSFTFNYLAGTFINQDNLTETQLANRYRLRISTNPNMTSPQEYTTTALFYAFTSLTQPTYYVTVRAEVFIDGGYEFSEWTTPERVDLVADPILALNPLYYLNGDSLNDLGTAGGTWNAVGTVNISSGYNFVSSSNPYIHRSLATTFDIGSSNTTPFVLVFWATLGNTTTTGRHIVSLVETLLSATTPTLGLAGNGTTTNLSIIRANPSSVGASAACRDNTMKKIVLEWRSGNYSWSVNNTVVGSVSRPTSPFNMNHIAIGATVNSASALGFVDNPIVKKFAFWRGTVPTTTEINNLPLTV